MSTYPVSWGPILAWNASLYSNPLDSRRWDEAGHHISDSTSRIRTTCSSLPTRTPCCIGPTEQQHPRQLAQWKTTSSPTNTPLGPSSRRRSTTTSSTTSSMKDDNTLNNYFTNLSEQLALFTTGYWCWTMNYIMKWRILCTKGRTTNLNLLYCNLCELIL